MAPIFNTEGRIRIRQGRHPLLDPKKVVPIDVHLGDTFHLLIITGPNTGTVPGRGSSLLWIECIIQQHDYG